MQKFKVFSVLLLVSGQLTVSHAVTESQKIVAVDPYVDGHFGSDVAMNGSTAIVGAPQHGNGGAAYIFERENSIWVKKQKLIASDAEAGDRFGESVDISGDLAIVGAPRDADGRPGAAYVFVRQRGNWTQLQKLTPNDSSDTGSFGNSVAILAKTALIGAPGGGAGGLPGYAYIFVQEGGITGVWNQHQRLAIRRRANQDAELFGWSVALTTDMAIIGAPGDSDDGVHSGSAHIFTRSGGVWSEEAELTASDASAEDGFGISVDIYGTRAIVGTSDSGDAHKAYIFRRVVVNPGGPLWGQEAILTPPEPAKGFGSSVAISAAKAAVGAAPGNLPVHIFKRSNSIWFNYQELTASDQSEYDDFGWAVDISDSRGAVIVGARHAYGDAISSGAAYIYNGIELTVQASPIRIGRSFEFTALFENGSDRLEAGVGVFALTDNGSAVLLNRKQMCFNEDSETKGLLYATQHFPSGLPNGLAFLTVMFSSRGGERVETDILVRGVQEKLTEDQEAQLATIAAEYAALLTLEGLNALKLGSLEDLAGRSPGGSGTPTRR